MTTFQLYLLALFVACTKSSSEFAYNFSFDQGKYNVSYNFNASSDTLEFLVEVQATGWVGFGFALTAPTEMMNYDVAVGGVFTNGSAYLQDYFTGGRVQPPLDSQQDWNLQNATEHNGVTTLKFYRKRNTTDAANDTAIEEGQSYFLIWAYNSTNDVQQPDQFERHSSRGFQRIEVIPTVPPPPTTEMPVNSLSFDNNQFLVQWMFDADNDKMIYYLRVKTTGWVGFGFAKVAPNNMVDYDVIVGGFMNNEGYLSDYKTFGRRQPTLDANQDYTLLNASEVGGYTELKFERPRDTNDVNDLAFGAGDEVFVIWAYRNEDITSANDFEVHSSRGWSANKVVMVGADQPIPTKAKASTLYASICVALSAALLNILFM